MALQRDTRYPGRWTAASGGHPQGAFKNRSAPGALDGSYIEQDWANDWDGFFSSLLNAASITPNGSVDAVGASQYIMALQRGGTNYAVATGTANAIVAAFNPVITARSESTPLRVKIAFTNTTACTINDGIGVVALVGGAHAALQGGELVANGHAWVVWNASIGGGSYVLLFCTGAPEQVAPAAQSQHAIQLSQMAAVTGGTRNAKLSVAAASATATFTADEIAVKAALSGVPWLLSSFNKTINLGTTGAGGMDTGLAPVSGFVAIYAIYNPITATSALLATDITSSTPSEIYGGGAMPAGYTASALVSVWGTDGSRLLKIGYQQGRYVAIVPVAAISTTTPAGTLTALNLSPIVPRNAISFTAFNNIAAANSGVTMTTSLAGSTTLLGIVTSATTSASGGAGITAGMGTIPIITMQVTYYTCAVGAGAIAAFTATVTGYNF